MNIQYAPTNNVHERALRKAVYETLEKSGQAKLANFSWYFKALLFLSCYCVLVIAYQFAPKGPLLILIATLCGMFTVFIGISIGHDAAHQSISHSKSNNQWWLLSFHLVGANAAIWCDRHNFGHHPYANIPKKDTDIEQTKLVRFSSADELFWWHRFQVFYLPILLCTYSLNWFFHRDVKDLILLLKKQSGVRKISLLLLGFLLTKGLHIAFYLVLPAWINDEPWWNFLPFFLTLHLSASLVVSVVLLAAHVGSEQQFPIPDENGKMAHTFFEHQLLTTADFGTSSRILNFFFGGFNHHVAHHLFPEINHIHYPQLTPVIKDYLIQNGLPYLEHKRWSGSIKSHYQLLMREGDI